MISSEAAEVKMPYVLFCFPQAPASVTSTAPTRGRVIQSQASAPVSPVSGGRSVTAVSQASGTSAAL